MDVGRKGVQKRAHKKDLTGTRSIELVVLIDNRVNRLDAGRDRVHDQAGHVRASGFCAEARICKKTVRAMHSFAERISGCMRACCVWKDIVARGVRLRLGCAGSAAV